MQADCEPTGVVSVDVHIEEETEIAVETVSEDDDDSGNTPKSVAEATEDSPMAGATILEPIDPDGVTCEEECVKSEHVEDEWEVARDGDQVASDEVLTFDNDTADKLESYEKTCAIVNDDDQEPIFCDGGSAELKTVFHLEHCCKLSDQSSTRLTNELQSDDPAVSSLGQLVKAHQLRSERNIYQKKASQLRRYPQSQPRGTQKHIMAFTNNSQFFLKPTTIKDLSVPQDTDAEELIAGYGMKLGPHGGLIPRNCPDVQARWSVSDAVVG